MVVAEPPEPVAAFGDEQLAPGLGQLFLGLASFGNSGQQVLPRLVHQIPRAIALVMADPDAEVVLDPTAREEMSDLVGRGMWVQIISDARRAELWVAGDACIQLPQELDAATGVVLPAVFAVEHDADQGRPMAGVA